MSKFFVIAISALLLSCSSNTAQRALTGTSWCQSTAQVQYVYSFNNHCYWVNMDHLYGGKHSILTVDGGTYRHDSASMFIFESQMGQGTFIGAIYADSLVVRGQSYQKMNLFRYIKSNVIKP
ncbi:MAG: hypothetical protein RR931_03830 [Mucinivorans sp.]